MGLGNNHQVEDLEVHWPGGATQKVAPLIDRLTTVSIKHREEIFPRCARGRLGGI